MDCRISPLIVKAEDGDLRRSCGLEYSKDDDAIQTREGEADNEGEGTVGDVCCCNSGEPVLCDVFSVDLLGFGVVSSGLSAGDHGVLV